MAKRFGGHKCIVCGSKWDGVGSKAEAEACEDLGEPTHLFRGGKDGDHVKITKGRGKGKVYKVLHCGYKRKVVKRKGKIVSAQHVKQYYLVDHKGRPRIGWPWVQEYRLKLYTG